MTLRVKTGSVVCDGRLYLQGDNVPVSGKAADELLASGLVEEVAAEPEGMGVAEAMQALTSAAEADAEHEAEVRASIAEEIATPATPEPEPEADKAPAKAKTTAKK